MKILKKISRKIFGSHLNHSVKESLLEKQIKSGEILINKGTITPNIRVEIRDKRIKKNYLKIGENSVVSGSFYFENKNGNIIIGNDTFIGGGKFISIESINIGSNVLISWGCTFMDNNAHSLVWNERKNDIKEWKKGLEENKLGAYKNWKNVKSAPIVVKDKVWIGFDVIILKGVTIGEGVIVAAGSVVTKGVPDWTVIAGNPAKVVKEIPLEER